MPAQKVPGKHSKGMLSFEELKTDVEENDGEGRFDTVIVAGVDMQSRLIGKHMTAEFFIDEGNIMDILLESHS